MHVDLKIFDINDFPCRGRTVFVVYVWAVQNYAREFEKNMFAFTYSFFSSKALQHKMLVLI